MTDRSKVTAPFEKPDQIRLQKFMADAGVASRRACETLITSGRVSINGMPVTVLGTKINPLIDTDSCADGRYAEIIAAQTIPVKVQDQDSSTNPVLFVHN